MSGGRGVVRVAERRSEINFTLPPRISLAFVPAELASLPRTPFPVSASNSASSPAFKPRASASVFMATARGCSLFASRV